MDEASREHLEKELLPFLKLDARIDVKSVAVRYVLEMTGTKEGLDFISKGEKFLAAIMELTSDSELDIKRDSYLALINLSAEEKISHILMNSSVKPTFIYDVLLRILKPDCAFADEASSIISNVTRSPPCAIKLSEQILSQNSKVTMEGIVDVLCKVNFNKKAYLHNVALILSNLTQVPAIRKIIMDKDRCIVQKLLPFTDFSQSAVRRGGIIGTLRNCCFEYDYHPWLLGADVDILPRLLLPLAGPEEFDDDEMEKLPVDIQYLPPDKKREPDGDIRTMLIESLIQLCSTHKGRIFVKDKNAYVVLRELHKWERDAKTKTACHKLCELLIRDEPERGAEELHEVKVPDDLVGEFETLDLELLKDVEENIKDKEELEKKEKEELEKAD